MKFVWIAAGIILMGTACPRESPPKKPDKPKVRTLHSPASLSQPQTSGPPELTPEMKVLLQKNKHQRQAIEVPLDVDQRENRQNDRRESSEMLLLTAEREHKAGRADSAMQLCDQAQKQGGGLARIGYRPKLCKATIWAAAGQWDLILSDFEAVKHVRETWAGYAHWVLMAAKAATEKGDKARAKIWLGKIKKHPEVASEAQRALRVLERN